MVEDVFYRENDNLAKPNKTAKQIIDAQKNKMIFIVILLVTLPIIISYWSYCLFHLNVS